MYINEVLIYGELVYSVLRIRVYSYIILGVYIIVTIIHTHTNYLT